MIPSRISETTGTVQTRVRRQYYNDMNNVLTYGREKRCRTTRFPDRVGAPKTNFTRQQDYRYESQEDGFLQSVTLTTHDGITATRSTLRHPVLGYLLSENDTQNVTVTYSYDKIGRPVTRTVAPGSQYERKTTWAYRIDTTGPVITETDPAGNQTNLFLDGLCRKIQQQRLDKDLSLDMFDIAHWSYSPLGELTSNDGIDWETKKEKNEKLSLTMTTTYDGWGNISEQVTSDGIQALRVTNPVALNVRTYTQGLSDENELRTGTQTFELDERNLQPKKEERSDISGKMLCTRLYQWDGFSRLRRLTDELGLDTTLTYDVHGRELSRTLPDGTIIERTYAPHLTGNYITSINIKTEKDATGNPKTWVLGSQEFDGLGRLVKRISGGRTTTFTYEGASPVPSKVTSPSGNIREYHYIRELGNAVNKVTAGSIMQVFEYHEKTGELISAEENGIKIERTLYPSGRLQKETNTLTESVFDANYSYTLRGGINYFSDITQKKTGYKRDSFGRIITITDDELTINLEYDLLGRLSQHKTTDNKNTQATLTTTLGYDDFGRESSRTINDSSGINIVISQTWQKNDLLATRITQQNGVRIRKEAFVYDTRNRLTEYTVSESSRPTDAYGNKITAQKYQYDALNNLTKVTTALDVGTFDFATYHYENKDDPMQLTSVEHTLTDTYPANIVLEYDADGRMTKDESGRVRHYDTASRLINLDDTYSYRYDAFNRLVSQTLSDTDIRQLYYRSDRLVNEVQVTQQTQTITRRIGDGYTCLGVSNGDNLILTASDQHGSLQWSRDTSQETGTRFEWSPFGGGSPKGLLPAFNGERPDPATGNYPLGNGYRDYSPKLMRFTCPDSLSPFGAGGINPYAYCAGDPINLTDPSGHISWQGIVGIMTGIIGIGFALVTGGMSVMAAGCISAAIDATSTTTLVAGGLGLLGDATGIASGALENRNPEASSVLGWVSMATGLASAVAGMGAVALAGKTVTRRGAEALRFSYVQEMQITSPKVLGFHDFVFNPHGDSAGINPTYVAIDVDSGVRRLNIVAHGAPGKALMNGNHWVNAEGLYQVLNDHGVLGYNFTEIRMLMCHSADAPANGISIAQRLSQLTGVPVEGFHGTMTMAASLWIPAGDGTIDACTPLKNFIVDAFMTGRTRGDDGYWEANMFLHQNAHRITVNVHPAPTIPNFPQRFYP